MACTSKCYDGVISFPKVFFFISFIAIKTNFIFSFYYTHHSHIFYLVLENQGEHLIFHITYFLVVPDLSEDFGTS